MLFLTPFSFSASNISCFPSSFLLVFFLVLPQAYQRPSCRCGQSDPRLSIHKKAATRYNPAMAASVVSSDFQFCVTFFHRKNLERQRAEANVQRIERFQENQSLRCTGNQAQVISNVIVLSKPIAECHLIFFN